MSYFYQMKLKDWAEQYNRSLISIYEIQEVQAIFLRVIYNVFGFNRAEYLLNKDKMPTEEQFGRLQYIEAELKAGKPLQYIICETEFYGMNFKVNAAVLIPRPETEELVEWVIESAALAETTGSNTRIIDIGTGSGCIAIALKKYLPGAELFALDVSEKALEVAKHNASLNQVDIDFISEDIRTFKTKQKFDLIVSNPPYITNLEKTNMHSNVLDHEPHLALFVENERPLEFYEAIADFAWLSLSDMGLLFFEINEHLGKEMIEMLTLKSFVNIELRKDMQGKDRMIKCQKNLI